MIKKYSLKADGNTRLSTHFKVKEFACKDGSDTILINPELIVVLERLFTKLNAKAINIQSGYRTNSHSKRVGGYAGDQHTQGNAADIWAKKKDGTKFSSQEITIALEELGHNGGIGLINKSTHVHVDVRGKRVWFDETNHEKLVKSWKEYWGVSTPKPVPKPTPNTDGLTPYVLTCKMLKVRKSPSTLSRRVGQYYSGEVFYVRRWQGNWCQLKSGNWMCAKKYSRKA